MIMLGVMEVMWKVDDEISAFKYSFVDCVIKGHYGQDCVQVADVIQ